GRTRARSSVSSVISCTSYGSNWHNNQVDIFLNGIREMSIFTLSYKLVHVVSREIAAKGLHDIFKTNKIRYRVQDGEAGERLRATKAAELVEAGASVRGAGIEIGK